MGDDCDAALVADARDGLLERQPGGDPLADPERKHVAGGAADLRAGDPDQIIVRRALGGREAGVDLVVVGDRERVETDGLGLGEQEVDRIAAVEGEF